VRWAWLGLTALALVALAAAMVFVTVVYYNNDPRGGDAGQRNFSYQVIATGKQREQREQREQRDHHRRHPSRWSPTHVRCAGQMGALAEWIVALAFVVFVASISSVLKGLMVQVTVFDGRRSQRLQQPLNGGPAANLAVAPTASVRRTLPRSVSNPTVGTPPASQAPGATRIAEAKRASSSAVAVVIDAELSSDSASSSYDTPEG
jgi:hypothetical protein